MRLDFLFASNGLSIGKTIRQTTDGFDITPFPKVRDLDSATIEIDPTIEALHEALLAYGDRGAALMKGHLKTPLQGQSKSGNFDPLEPTLFALLDNDFNDGFDSIDAFLTELDPRLTDVSYVFQHSASAGVKNPIGLRGHIFLLLEQAHHPGELKEWLIGKNLELPALRQRIELSANGLALKYPLDVTVNNNYVPVYIAPPTFVDCEDPLKDRRTVLVKKARDRANVQWTGFAQANKDACAALVNELRKAKGLKKRTPKFNRQGTILLNPDVVSVEAKEERGFTYLNLNGGDSWGYYFPTGRPEVVYNFKGEPNVYLKDIAPEYYKQVVENLTAHGTSSSDTETPIPLAIHDLKTDRYLAGFYTANPPNLELHKVSTTKKLEDFMAQNGAPIPDTIPIWSVEFDPSTTKLIEFEQRWCNTFKPSEYMLTEYPESKPLPPNIDKLLMSICVDEETRDYFLNWLAYIFVTRDKTGTGWIFSGTTGTGKGMLFQRLLAPLFGHEQAMVILTENLEEKFNSYAVGQFIVFCDEFSGNSHSHSRKMMDRLKNLITEPYINVRKMGTDPTKYRNYANLIIATNHREDLPLTDNDRRFNIAPRQETSLNVSSQFGKQVEAELYDFAAFLTHYDIDAEKVRKPLENAARTAAILVATNTVDAFFEALREGDLDYFLQFDDGPSRSFGGAPDMRYDDFIKVLTTWKESINRKIKVSRTDLEKVYSYIQNQTTTSAKFSRMARIRGIDIKPTRIDGTLKQGTTITFTSTEIQPEESPAHDNVSPIREPIPQRVRPDLSPGRHRGPACESVDEPSSRA